MNFYTKAAAQFVLSYLPYGRYLSDEIRKRKLFSTRTPYSTLSQCLRQINHLQDQGLSIEGKTVLELGTGWKPIFPLLYKLLGAENVLMVDLRRYSNLKFLEIASSEINYYFSCLCKEFEERGIESLGFEKKLKNVSNIISNAKSFHDALRSLKIQYLAPYDACNLPLENSSIDVYFSRAVLEHVEVEKISGIYQEAFRIVKPSSGIMIHDIDISDHWSYFDKSITDINFLSIKKFPWKLINSPIAYQNRLRQKDHLELISSANFSIQKVITRSNDLDSDTISQFKRRIIPEFKELNDSELKVSGFTVISKPKK